MRAFATVLALTFIGTPVCAQAPTPQEQLGAYTLVIAITVKAMCSFMEVDDHRAVAKLTELGVRPRQYDEQPRLKRLIDEGIAAMKSDRPRRVCEGIYQHNGPHGDTIRGLVHRSR